MVRLDYFSYTKDLFISLSDIIDILIVSYIIYKIMLWIKDTRAWSLFKGIAIILIAFVLAYIFNLNTLYWIISKTFSVGLLAVMILFQPEMRKALEQIGKRNIIKILLKSKDEKKISDSVVKQIVKAAKIMASKKTGALIVIEKEVPLGDFEQTGILIDAIVSNQLLINIFEDKTPLHDGAVIIRENKRKAAACILPLSPNVAKHDFGTRHRAAIGASEVSDAYILVVSEERGEISIAKNGKLHRDLNEKQVKNILSGINNSVSANGNKTSILGKLKIKEWSEKTNDQNKNT